jgi:hypothetical protein
MVEDVGKIMVEYSWVELNPWPDLKRCLCFWKLKVCSRVLEHG